MMSHSRQQNFRESFHRRKMSLFVWSHRISLIASRPGWGQILRTAHPASRSLARSNSYFRKLHKMVGCHPIIPQKGPIFCQNCSALTLRLVQPWFDSVEIILSPVTNSKWFIHSSSLGPSTKSRFVLFPWIDHWIHISDILSLIMLPFGINKRNVWNVFSVSNIWLFISWFIDLNDYF